MTWHWSLSSTSSLPPHLWFMHQPWWQMVQGCLCHLAWHYWGPTLEQGLGAETRRLPARPSQEMATWILLVDSPPTGRFMRDKCNVLWVVGGPGASMTQSSDQNPTLVQEGERYRLEIAWVLKPGSLRGAGPSTTRSCPGWVAGGWHGLTYSSTGQPPCAWVYSSEREGHSPASLGRWQMRSYGLCLRAKQQYKIPGLPWQGYLIVVRLGTPFFYFNAYVGNNSDTRIGVTTTGDTAGWSSWIPLIHLSMRNQWNHPSWSHRGSF